MALSKEERDWLDEKFKNLHSRINDMGGDVKEQRSHGERITKVEGELKTRPTFIQLLTAVIVSTGLIVTIIGIIVTYVVNNTA